MKTFKIAFCALILFNFSLAIADDVALPMASRDCLKCHSPKISANDYYNSVHKETTCLACHIKDEVKDENPAPQISGKKKCVLSFKAIDCARCHAQAVKDHADSIHNSKRLPVSCAKCHAEIHAIKSHKNDKLSISKQCSLCHKQQLEYFESGHHKALLEGRTDSATCTDCHGLHAISKIDKRSGGRVFDTKSCLKCHSDEKMMAKSKLTVIAPETFFESYHGKNVRLGYPQKVAGCADCHSAHLILKSKESKSSVNPGNLVKTCGRCHANSSLSFSRFIPHANPLDHQKYPILFWTFVAMTALLVGTFLFFWVHSGLWAMRSFVERRRNARAASFPDQGKSANLVSEVHALKDGKKLYRRFKPLHIYLHLLVVTSFLGLALTGLPLKFSATPWGKALIDFIGGTARAGLIHRGCAILTFGYFSVAVAMSVHFLFFDKKVNGTVRERLLGPDSLFPNLRDLQDMTAMFKWFFFRGPKPSFERWTYWEKFDFLAVFWGMFAIGSSGLMLWFPEFFGRILPGWMFNVATIVHSDEALLATGFIFTVHFFNTHFRPEKFPMDFVIFNGEITKEEMVEERADQWRRYEAEGSTEEHLVTKPSSILRDLVLKSFGFFALFVGITLAIIVVYTLMGRS